MRDLRIGSGLRLLAATVSLMAVLFVFPLSAFSDDPIEKALTNDDEVEDELKYLKEETYVITPSRIPQRNATLIGRNFSEMLKGLEVRAAVKNLFNKDYTSPVGLGLLPDDIPMPGINFFLELRYTF